MALPILLLSCCRTSTKFPFVNAVDGNKMTPMHKKFPVWAKKQLLDLEITVTELASRIRYPRQTTSAALNGSTRFPHVTQAIAETLNHDPKTDGPLPARPARPERRVRLTAARTR